MKYSISRIILQCRLGSNQNHPSSTQVSFDIFQFDFGGLRSKRITKHALVHEYLVGACVIA